MRQGITLDRVSRVVEGEIHLSDVSLTLEAGSFNVLLGRTRAGKTSLLRLLAGLDRPGAGSVRFDGADVTHLDVRRRKVAMVYQQFVNYPSLTVYENIASPLRLAKLDAREIDRRVRETAATLRVEGLLDRLPAELSGGQQQRTAMARALVKGADLLLLDEPLANLDYKLREELRTEIRQLFERRSAVVVYATTEPAEALLLGGRTTVLDEGRILQSGPTLEVYHAPASERVGQVFSDPQMTLLAAEVSAGGEARLSAQVTFPLTGHLRALPPGPCRLGVRAHHILLGPASGEDIRIPARVEVEEVNGSETLLHASGPERTSLTAQLQGVHRHSFGTALDLFISPARMFAFDPAGRLLAAPPFRTGTAAHGPH